MQTGPRDNDAVMASRYWLTDKGYAALAQAQPTDDGDDS